MIRTGSKVRIKSQENKTGNVLQIKDNFASIHHEGKTEWIPLSDLNEISDELLNKLIKNELDKEIDFILAMDAYRLHIAQLWEPYVFASSNRIQIFPHQIDEVTWALDNSKILIADEVGLGKTIIAALVSAELRARGLVKRTLYVVPKSLILKWKDELNEKFQIDTQILGSSYQRVNQDTFKQNDFSYIASMDYLKQEHIKEYLSDSHFDLVIIDEAHKLKLHTDRMALGKVLSEKSNMLMFLTATPHDGRDDDFIKRMQLLDPWISDVASSSHLWVRNIKEDVLDINGQQVFPSRKSETVEFGLTPTEENIYTLLDKYMNNRAEEATAPNEINAIRFVRIIFRKRCSSSIKALEISLGRRLEKLGTVNVNNVLKSQKAMHQSEEEFEEEDFEEDLKNPEAYTASENIEQEKYDLRKLIQAIKELGDVDTKQQRLIDFVKNLKKEDTKAKLILFTEYRDTLNSLYDVLSQTYKVGKIDGTMSIEERKRSLNSFRDLDGEEVLLCTDAAGEGIDMQFCNIEINYDLPWNPNKLEQRMGRIHRIGQTRDVYYYNFVIKNDKSIDGYIFRMLLEKIEHIKEAMDDKIYDVLGRIVTEEDITKLYAELATIPHSNWEPKGVEFTEKIEANKKRILKENEQLLTSNKFDRTKLEDIQKIRKHAIDKGEIKRFIQTYVGANDGNCQVIKMADDTYKISLPRNIAHKFDESIFQGTFDGDVAIKKNWAYLALGNKNITQIIKHVAKPSVTCLMHETKNGLLSIYKLVVMNKRNIVQNTKILSLFQNEDGKIDVIDTRSLWSYEGSNKFNVQTNLLTSFKERSDAYVREELIDFTKKTQARIDKVKQSSEVIASRYFSTQSESIMTHISELRKKIGEGPHIEKIIKVQLDKKTKLEKEYHKRMDDIDIDFQIHNTFELVGLAWVVPGFEANIRTEIEKAGQDAVIQHEKDLATTPEEENLIQDVSNRDTGYDVESFGGKCIEVKSFKTTGSPKITSHEWETARRIKDDYWLYIVENALDNPKITQFQNPFNIFKDTINKEEVLEYRYVINDWKQKI